MMNKILLTFLALASLAGVTVASSPHAAADDPPAAQTGHPWLEERAALLDARLAGLKAGLKLTAEQDKNWPAFEGAVRGVAKARAERWAARRETDGQDAGPSLIERLRERSDRLAQRSADLKSVADAAAPLYASLDDGQKRIFGLLLRDLAPSSRLAARHWGEEAR